MKIQSTVKTVLKRNLDRKEYCLQRKAFTVPRIFNLTSSTSIKRNLPATEKFPFLVFPLKGGLTVN